MIATAEIIQVPEDKLKRMATKSCCHLISEKKPVSSVIFKNQRYIITGVVSSGNDGLIELWGNRFVPLESYAGDLKPLTYWEYQNEVNQGKRERGYNALITVCDNARVVMIRPRVTFVPIAPTGEQASLF